MGVSRVTTRGMRVFCLSHDSDGLGDQSIAAIKTEGLKLPGPCICAAVALRRVGGTALGRREALSQLAWRQGRLGRARVNGCATRRQVRQAVRSGLGHREVAVEGTPQMLPVHRVPHQAALPRRRDDWQLTQACPPSRTPALTSAPPNPFSPVRNRPPNTCLRRPKSLSTTAPASRPSGRYAVGLRPSLDPDA
jgi:hypothetical protein